MPASPPFYPPSGVGFCLVDVWLRRCGVRGSRLGPAAGVGCGVWAWARQLGPGCWRCGFWRRLGRLPSLRGALVLDSSGARWLVAAPTRAPTESGVWPGLSRRPAA
jgi:hypothetical protein